MCERERERERGREGGGKRERMCVCVCECVCVCVCVWCRHNAYACTQLRSYLAHAVCVHVCVRNIKKSVNAHPSRTKLF